MPDDNHIFVSRPVLPSQSELLPLLDEIWASATLTNNGPIHARFEAAVAGYLGVEQVSVVANATLGLMLALRQLGATGEVITTPFSFVATAHALKWTCLEPVFADVDPVTLNLDPAAIERAITPRTTAILPVHCFGARCDVEGIQAVAERHGLKVLYDAAHAFAVQDDGGSILRHGDMSVVSFHATKVFNTFEGGAVICPDRNVKLAIDRLRNFGIVDEVNVESVGLNAKLSELASAIGLLQLRHVDDAITRRARADGLYRERLADMAGIKCVDSGNLVRRNFYSFPVLVGEDFPMTRDALCDFLRGHGIHARRYFFPLISNLALYGDLPSASWANLPVANDISSRILCLPLYPDLSTDDQERILGLIRQAAS